MSPRATLLKQAEKKEHELREAEIQVRELRSYLQAMYDAIKLLPRDPADQSSNGVSLRPGSDLAKVREMLSRIRRPLRIGELLSAIGKEDNAANRASLAGSLGPYVRKGEIFTRPAPNTFGLVDFPASSLRNGESDDEITVDDDGSEYGTGPLIDDDADSEVEL